MNNFNDVVDNVYNYLVSCDDPDKCKERIDKVLEFVIRLRHSYVDNDKPKSSMEINDEILEIAKRSGLRVGYVELG